MPTVVIGRVDEMPPGTKRHIEVVGRGIAVFNVAGRFFALRDTCPHRGGPLSAGTIVGSITSTMPGYYEYDPVRKFIKCPWHGWEYDLETGQSSFDPANRRVRAYPVAIKAGAALLAEPAPPAGDRQPGPYVVEKVDIRVAGDYVVVEV
jgi:3-phenylpropionate/trans-cinnamate dioxygenase ferredoxin subunit